MTKKNLWRLGLILSIFSLSLLSACIYVLSKPETNVQKLVHFGNIIAIGNEPLLEFKVKPEKKNHPMPIIAFPFDDSKEPSTLAEQRERLLFKLEKNLELSSDQIEKIKQVINSSHWLGQGNPEIVRHPVSRKECRTTREQLNLVPQFNEQCKAWNMVPIYNKENVEKESDAKVCVDQFEFPNIPCEYPVVWVRAKEAADLCSAEGKRICDAHEWEGACFGSLLEPKDEYAFGQKREDQTNLHNSKRKMGWAYGEKKNHRICATNGSKGLDCNGGDWKNCGSNTSPAGSFPECVSPFGVYDQHGNAAEHMNLPLEENQLASKSGLGETEMKGSWFIFSIIEAHKDDCRWRAPDWHAGPVNSPASHYNYHLGFRCCKDITSTSSEPEISNSGQ